MMLVRDGAFEQSRQGDCSRPMDTGAQRSLYRFQVDAAGLPAFGEDAAHQRRYFARDLGLDRLRRFFSSGVSVSATGRNVQIFSLTATI